MIMRSKTATAVRRQERSFPHRQVGANETMSVRYLLFLLVAGYVILAPRGVVAEESKLPLILKEDFEHGFSRWKTTDPDPKKKSVWKIIEVGEKGNHALRCTGISDYKPKYRSPLSFALLKDVEVT